MPSVQPGARHSVCQGWVAWRHWGARRTQGGVNGKAGVGVAPGGKGMGAPCTAATVEVVVDKTAGGW